MGKVIRNQMCPSCNQKFDIELPDDILEGKKRFPFEYLYIHGNPPHAMGIFLDGNLSVREILVHNDLGMQSKTEQKIELEEILNLYKSSYNILKEDEKRKAEELISALNHCKIPKKYIRIDRKLRFQEDGWFGLKEEEFK